MTSLDNRPVADIPRPCSAASLVSVDELLAAAAGALNNLTDAVCIRLHAAGREDVNWAEARFEIEEFVRARGEAAPFASVASVLVWVLNVGPPEAWLSDVVTMVDARRFARQAYEADQRFRSPSRMVGVL